MRRADQAFFRLQPYECFVTRSPADSRKLNQVIASASQRTAQAPPPGKLGVGRAPHWCQSMRRRLQLARAISWAAWIRRADAWPE